MGSKMGSPCAWGLRPVPSPCHHSLAALLLMYLPTAVMHSDECVPLDSMLKDVYGDARPGAQPSSLHAGCHDKDTVCMVHLYVPNLTG